MKTGPWTLTYLREYRKKVPLSLEKAAHDLGFEDHTQLSRIERGVEPWHQRLIESAAKLYKATPMQILFIHPDRKEAITEAARVLNDWKDATSPPVVDGLDTERVRPATPANVGKGRRKSRQRRAV